MYVPVLHARQSERLAIKDIAAKLRAAGNVHPLAIPVRDDKKSPGVGLRNTVHLIKLFSSLKVPYSILVTPYAAKVEQTQAQIQQALGDHDGNRMATPVVAVTASKPISKLKAEIQALPKGSFGVLHQAPSDDIAALVALLNTYKQRITTHYFYGDECSDSYIARWTWGTRVLIEDGFKKKAPNSAYSDPSDESYSALGFRYKRDGFDGYGDHTICGENYVPGGGAVLTIAIHLTYPAPLVAKKYDEIRVRHFLSNSSTALESEAECFHQARRKLVRFYDANRPALSFSMACASFKAMITYPKLMTVKKLSIQHHIEMMSHLNL